MILAINISADSRASPARLIMPHLRALHWLAGSLAALAVGCLPETSRPAADEMRLISTAPHLTECVCAVGAGDLLAGRTDSCDYPPEIAGSVPVTGRFGAPWIEPLLAANPTHVLETVLADPAVTARLTALGITVTHVPCTRLSEIPDALRQIGVLTGHQQKGMNLAADIERGLAAARRQKLARPARRALLLFAPDMPITAGRRAFVSELMELAGAMNISADTEPEYYHISLESIIRHDPDLILCLFEHESRDPHTLFNSRPGWKTLRAVRAKRVYALADLNTVSRPGPRVLQGLAQFQQILALDAREPFAP
ncbi:MAG: helical backbone metal receptor [Kiritimatiellae bacterium]|nr:helical backbone metal receptor [Kiritimatiellia bacterium]MDD3545068.1 helical backbone metal receptor [Kiritimatiellia bacterium]MDD4025491.1 helical backbone metal receptor [Kiritimatiellia bacterium]MDD4622973.1 helical backbone metal receptor [Kiritimatiellia bacterium]